MVPFRNRSEAGRLLAVAIRQLRGLSRPLALGLPRGGVPVAFAVAEDLEIPLDALIVRKLGAPGQEELAVGAIASGGIRVLDEDLIRELRIPAHAIERIAAEEKRTLDEREQLYRGGLPALDLRHRTVILVDDGIATGATMLAAVRAVRLLQPDSVIVASPVASVDARDRLSQEAGKVICLATPDPFYSVSAWYEDFPQVSDTEVRRQLARAAHGRH